MGEAIETVCADGWTFNDAVCLQSEEWCAAWQCVQTTLLRLTGLARARISVSPHWQTSASSRVTAGGEKIEVLSYLCSLLFFPENYFLDLCQLTLELPCHSSVRLLHPFPSLQLKVYLKKRKTFSVYTWKEGKHDSTVCEHSVPDKSRTCAGITKIKLKVAKQWTKFSTNSPWNIMHII